MEPGENIRRQGDVVNILRFRADGAAQVLRQMAGHRQVRPGKDRGLALQRHRQGVFLRQGLQLGSRCLQVQSRHVYAADDRSLREPVQGGAAAEDSRQQYEYE